MAYPGACPAQDLYQCRAVGLCWEGEGCTHVPSSVQTYLEGQDLRVEMDITLHIIWATIRNANDGTNCENQWHDEIVMDCSFIAANVY